MTGGESEVDELLAYAETTLPVLQDTAEVDLEGTYGAAKWYFYLGDSAGNLRYVHYELDLDSERDRFLTELYALSNEGAK